MHRRPENPNQAKERRDGVRVEPGQTAARSDGRWNDGSRLIGEGCVPTKPGQEASIRRREPHQNPGSLVFSGPPDPPLPELLIQLNPVDDRPAVANSAKSDQPNPTQLHVWSEANGNPSCFVPRIGLKRTARLLPKRCCCAACISWGAKGGYCAQIPTEIRLIVVVERQGCRDSCVGSNHTSTTKEKEKRVATC